MSPQTQLKAPNGVEFTLPTGLFINNEFVKSSSGDRITSISPRYVLFWHSSWKRTTLPMGPSPSFR